MLPSNKIIILYSVQYNLKSNSVTIFKSYHIFIPKIASRDGFATISTAFTISISIFHNASL